MLKVRDYKIVLCILMLLATGCTKRYWYRTKIDSPRSNKYSVQINIVNYTPELLTKQFTDGMHKAAAKSLKKYGYYETNVKSPRFSYMLMVSVLNDRHILFKAQFYDTKYGHKWDEQDYIYYFGGKRDIGRSASVVRRLIRISEQKRYEY